MDRVLRFLKVNVVAWMVIPIAISGQSSAQDWVRFRGPNGSGESDATTVPGKWTNDDYNWKTKLPGIGHSSPVIWGNKIFLLSAEPKDAVRYVLCVNADDGKLLWKREFPSTAHHLHTRSSYASCSPTVDAERVYVAWSDPKSTLIKAFTHDGEEAWSTDLGTWISQHGFGTSPMLYDDLVIVNCSQEPSKQPDTPDPKDSFVVALDRATGSMKWKRPRKIDTASFSVPCVLSGNNDAPPQLICCTTAEGIFSLNPKTGDEYWSLPVFDKRTVSSPIVAKGLVFGTTGSGGGGSYVVALRPGPKPEVAYEVRTQAPYVPTPVCNGDLMFLWSDKGIVTCIDVTTGTQHWQKRVTGNFSGSPIRVHDKLYCIDDDGVVVVMSATKQAEEIGRMELGEGSRATPAVSNGRMYLRTYSQLFSIGGKKS